MNGETQIRLLVSELDKQRTVLARITSFYDDYLRKKFEELRTAVIVDLDQFKEFLRSMLSAER
jgi:hypothetical protein